MICSEKTCDTECRLRHRAFWENSYTGVPLVYAVSDKPGFTQAPWKSSLPRKEWDLLPDWHMNQIDNFLEGTCFFGDAMPMASLMVGLDITNTAVLAGGDYDYSSTGHFIDFKAGGFDLKQPVPDFTPDHPLAVSLKHCYETIIPHVRDRAFVNTPMEIVCHRVDDAVLAARSLGPDGLYLLFELRFSSPDQALHAIDRVYDLCR